MKSNRKQILLAISIGIIVGMIVYLALIYFFSILLPSFIGVPINWLITVIQAFIIMLFGCCCSLYLGKKLNKKSKIIITKSDWKRIALYISVVIIAGVVVYLAFYLFC